MGLLDQPRFPFDHVDGGKLWDTLAQLYMRVRQVEGFCSRAKVPIERVDFNGNATDVWKSVLDTAARTGRLRDLARVIVRDPESVDAREFLNGLLDEPIEERATPDQGSPPQPTAAKPKAPEPAGNASLAEAATAQPSAGSDYMRVTRTLKGHRGWITCLCFSPDGGKLASADHYGQVLLWDLNTDAGPQSLAGHVGAVYSVAFNYDSSLLASAGADHAIRVRNLASSETLEFTDHSKAVLSIAFDHHGSRLASGSADCTVRLCDDVSQPEARSKVIGRHTDEVSKVVFNQADSLLASAGADRTVQLWKLPAGTPQYALHGHVGRVTGIAFTPDGQHIVSADWITHSLTVWNSETGRPRSSIPGIPCACEQEDWVPDLAFSPIGVLASAGYPDGSVRLWEVTTGNLIASLTGHAGPVSAVAFSQDGRLLATAGGRDHDVHIWL